MDRYIVKSVRNDLNHKMVFVAGPRQVGKTTLARQIVGVSGYLNWDVAGHRERILKGELPPSRILALDEIHKYRSWRNYIKGLYDGGRKHILVTGSARLDFYRFGGDSLQGRYHFFRLHPLSVKEAGIHKTSDLMDLLELGGFPEPFLGGKAVNAKRWSRDYRTRLVREEITSLERVLDLGNIELLMLRLPECVGSPLSINSLCEDLQVSHKTVSNWIQILERLYALFRIPPFGSPKIRAVKKEAKHYHLDWSLVSNRPARFENMAACHLLKWCHFEQDTKGRELELRYFRDVDGREVDFVVTEDRKPMLLVECKWNDDPISPSLRYLKKRFPNADAWQIFAAGNKDYISLEGIRVAPAVKLLISLT